MLIAPRPPAVGLNSAKPNSPARLTRPNSTENQKVLLLKMLLTSPIVSFPPGRPPHPQQGYEEQEHGSPNQRGKEAHGIGGILLRHRRRRRPLNRSSIRAHRQCRMSCRRRRPARLRRYGRRWGRNDRRITEVEAVISQHRLHPWNPTLQHG